MSGMGGKTSTPTETQLSIPLKVWVVQGNSDMPFNTSTQPAGMTPTRLEAGCRLSANEIRTLILGVCASGDSDEYCAEDQRTQGLINNTSPLFGVTRGFTWGGDIEVAICEQIPAPDPLHPNYDRSIHASVVMVSMAAFPFYLDSNRINLYFVGHITSIVDGGAFMGVTLDPKGATVSPTVEPNILLADLGRNETHTGVGALYAADVAYHIPEHEMAHFLLRRKNPPEEGDAPDPNSKYGSDEHVDPWTPTNILWRSYEVLAPVALPPSEQAEASNRFRGNNWKQP